MSSCVLITIAESISGYLIEVKRWRKHRKRKKRTTLISNDKIKTEYVCTEEAKNRYLKPNQRHEARKKRGAIVPVSNSKHSQSKMFIELLHGCCRAEPNKNASTHYSIARGQWAFVCACICRAAWKCVSNLVVWNTGEQAGNLTSLCYAMLRYAVRTFVCEP